jgi:hypothetical protein
MHKFQERGMEERIVTRRGFLWVAVMATAAVAGLTVEEISAPAAAMPLPPPADPVVPDADDNLHLAQTKEQRRRRRRRRRRERRWLYSRRRHGRRYRRRRRGYTYYYNGYYYARPWWTIEPGVYIYLDL